MVVFGEERLYSGKNGCIWAKMVVLGLKWLYSGNWLYPVKSGCVWAKVIVFRQGGCIQAK